MVFQYIDGLFYRGLHGIEAAEPFFKIDAGVADDVYVLLVNAALGELLKHFLPVHPLHAAVSMADDHDLLNAELKYADEQAAHHGTVGMVDNAAGILDDLGVPVL